MIEIFLGEKKKNFKKLFVIPFIRIQATIC